ALAPGPARRAPGPYASKPGAGITRQRSGEPPLSLPDRIERAVERKPVEIVGNDDSARGAGDVIETEERRGREIGRGDLGNTLPSAVGDHDDVGSGDKRRQRGKAAR